MSQHSFVGYAPTVTIVPTEPQWLDAKDVLPQGHVNVDAETIHAQVVRNIEAGWQHATPHERQDREVVLLAGGPSLSDQLPVICDLRSEGAALVTVNGAYQWAINYGLLPSAQIVLDARPFNARFTRPVVPGCKYLIASQVHPSTLEHLPRESTFLWHSGVRPEAAGMVIARVGAFFPTPGGSTVVLRALPLLRMLGFWRIHLFGFDSCVSADAHHAYDQPENDAEQVVPVKCGNRVFGCTPWMLHQASEFMDLVKLMGDEMELEVHGDGLISHIVKTGAAIEP